MHYGTNFTLLKAVILALLIMLGLLVVQVRQDRVDLGTREVAPAPAATERPAGDGRMPV
ncbi:hypothetical protein [Roseivivax sp. CAU 1761]